MLRFLSKLQNRRFLVLIIFGLAIYVLLPQVGNIKQSLSLLGHPRWWLVATAVGFSALTYCSAAATYTFLAFKKMAYGRTLLIQFAAMFINRLLPGGVGALGVSYAYLRRSDHTSAQAATVVTVNNGLGFIGHLLLGAVVIGFFHSYLPALSVRSPIVNSAWLWLIIVAAALIVAIAVGRYRFKLWRTLNDLGHQLLHYKRHPLSLAGALSTSMMLTLANIACLWVCLLAMHGSLSFVAVLVVFTFGVGLGNATPTPGGLGGIEAGLLAAFVAYHVSSSTALAATLLFRLISYWLALAVGALAFIVCERRGLLA